VRDLASDPHRADTARGNYVPSGTLRIWCDNSHRTRAVRIWCGHAAAARAGAVRV